jgi:DNA-binding transcriptional LysR family regulator
MNLKYLRTIQTIYQTGSFQKATNALNYAPSTVTFQVQQVEKQLQLQLFTKHGRRMLLTSAGQKILPLIEQLLDDADALSTFHNSDDSIQGTLSIAVPESLLTYQLKPVLQAFKKQAPHVALTIKVLNCYDIFAQMVDHNVDLAIHYDVRQYSTNIHTGPLKTYPLTLVGSPQLSLTEQDFITPHQSKLICQIQNDPHARYLEIFNQYLRNRQISLAPPLELWSIESIKQSVISNLGVAFLPTFTVATELESNQLVSLHTEISQPTLTAIAAIDQNQPQSEAQKLFIKILNQFSLRNR